MNNSKTDIELRPSPIFAFLKIVPFILFTIVSLYVANRYVTELLWISLPVIFFAIYRYIFIRQVIYLVTQEYIRVSKGIFCKQIDTVELFRVKDYIITEPFLLQVFKLMDLHLKTTDPENPIIWLRGIPRTNIVEVLRERVLESRRHNQIIEIN